MLWPSHRKYRRTLTHGRSILMIVSRVCARDRDLARAGGTVLRPPGAVSSFGGFRTPATKQVAPSLKRPASETLHPSDIPPARLRFAFETDSPGFMSLCRSPFAAAGLDPRFDVRAVKLRAHHTHALAVAPIEPATRPTGLTSLDLSKTAAASSDHGSAKCCSKAAARFDPRRPVVPV